MTVMMSQHIIAASTCSNMVVCNLLCPFVLQHVEVPMFSLVFCDFFIYYWFGYTNSEL